MSETLQKMISDGERIANLFEALTEGDKNIVLVYMSALRDKELADMDRAEKAGQEVRKYEFNMLCSWNRLVSISGYSLCYYGK